MPLVHDTPKPKGVKAFCDICTKCADACPVKALPFGAPKVGGSNISAIKGVKNGRRTQKSALAFGPKHQLIARYACGFARLTVISQNYSIRHG